MTRPAAVLALALVLAACAGSSATAEGPPQPRRNPNQLTREELAQPAVSSLTLYDAIQRLRPSWLSQRGATSVAGGANRLPQVMVNESSSAMDVLQSMRPSDVTLVEFMSGADATTLYGTGYVNGLIRVRTGGVR